MIQLFRKFLLLFIFFPFCFLLSQQQINTNETSPTVMNGFPIFLDQGFTSFTGPLMVDLDKDGRSEIITGSGSGGTQNRTIFIFKSDGTIFPGWPIQISQGRIEEIVVGDVDNDDSLDIIVVTDNLYVFHQSGELFEQFPIPIGDYYTYFVNIYDLDNNGTLELIFPSQHQLFVYDFNGELLQGWPTRFIGSAKEKPAIADIDGDSFAEIILSTSSWNSSIYNWDSSALHVYKHNGVELNGWPIFIDSSFVFNRPSVFQKNRDSVYIVVNVGFLNQVTLDAFSYTCIYSNNGQLINKWLLSSDEIGGGISFGDLDKNGSVEIVTGTHLNKRILISSFEGYVYQTPIIVGDLLAHDLNLAKVTTDNSISILASNNKLWVSTDSSLIYGYKFDGSHISWSPFPIKGLTDKSPSIADIDNNGEVDMVAITMTANDSNFLYVWRIPNVSYNIDEDFPWPMYGHDRYMTSQYGFIPNDVSVGVQSFENPNLQNFIQQNYPNPFNPKTKIKYEIAKSGFVSLKIYDVLGREIKTLVNENQNVGSYEVDFDANNLNSGIYFYKLSTNNFSEMKKMILVK